MRCPTLSELPPPLPGKTGWPWTEEGKQLPELMPDGSRYPRISIVTPNYNYGHFLEETIRSVLLQGYPNLDYIIIDGGSTDNSVDIIKRYEKWLAYWVTEKDEGQAQAINKGLAKSTGEIFNWINSDDVLAKEALAEVAKSINDFDVCAGTVCNFSENNQVLIQNQNLSAFNLIKHQESVIFHQPGIWMKTLAIREINGLVEKFDYTFDWDLLIRYLTWYPKINYTSNTLAYFRLHPDSKTVNWQTQFDVEREAILKDLLHDSKYQILHKYISSFFRKKNWYEIIDAEFKLKQQNRLLKTIKIASLSCLDPQIRWNRFTLGTIRKLLLL